MTCSQCEYFQLSRGALYVGDCLQDNDRITTLNSKAADFCDKFIRKELEKELKNEYRIEPEER